MSCERGNNENYRVVVTLPKSMATRCGDCCRGLGRLCAPCWPCVTTCGKYCCYTFLVLLSLAILWLGWWLVILLNYCHSSPGLALEDVHITNITLSQNTTMAATDTPWEVKTDISVNLSTWNPNTVAGCVSTLRRMYVYVDYQGQQIVKQEVPLGFGLKPRRSRALLLDLKGDHFPMQRDLQVELRNASAVEFKFRFDTRFMQNDRKAGWMRMACDVISKTPLNWATNSSGGGVVWSSCQAA